MLQTRVERRNSHQLPVRVFGLDSAGKPVNRTAWTVDVSQHGVRLKGLPCWNGPGETIGLRLGTEKARFRVVWVGKQGTPQEGQVGLLCLEAGKFTWGSPAASRTFAAAAAAAPAVMQRPPIGIASVQGGGLNNRRQELRYMASGGAKIQEIGSHASHWTTLDDISLGGCYVETTSPLPPGSRVEVLVHLADYQIFARGEVTAVHRLIGMGVRFTEMTPSNRERLQTAIHLLIQTGAAHA
ncbi:MAG TPA: PilZ domain-containing protein [Terriglobales bacterium]|jgi:hypothetical protein|nr:PilZ domain-containing protein [Terriglobales bacterium]